MEHFASPPHWEWWILGYFFFGGISGGSYALGTLLRFGGNARDESAARVAFITSFIALVPCPIFLTIDLGQPLLFWHMLVDTSNGGLAFKPDSPMSLGSWALLIFGVFSFVSFLGAIAEMILIVIFLVLLAIAGTIGKVLGVWIVLWLLVILGLLAPLAMRSGAARRWPPVAAPILALLGVLALRALVIFSAQT